jgi:Holliday junction resolvase
MTFIWADESVRRSKQAKKNKTKGNGFELEVVHKLREIGYEGCMSSRAVNKIADANKVDISDTNDELPINIQCRYTRCLF